MSVNGNPDKKFRLDVGEVYLLDNNKIKQSYRFGRKRRFFFSFINKIFSQKLFSNF